MTNAKILTIDIETAPFEAYTWGLWDQNIGLNQIKQETNLLSFAAKWLGSKKIIYRDTSGQRDKRDDRKLLADIWALLDEADIVVAQNGAAFDIKRINARLVVLGFPPYSPIRIIDTKLVAKKHFSFSSNRQEWLARYLAGSNKYKHGKMEMDDWIGCLHGKKASWAKMKKYNINDTIDCEKIYLKLRPWIEHHPNMGLFVEADRPVCPNCGSTHVNKHKERVTQASRYMQYQCQDCGKYARGKLMLTGLKKRRSMLS
jgi:RNase P subunit RPR2